MKNSLSGELYNRCKICLLKCSQFDSQDSLSTLFAVGELAAYREGIPEADSRVKRVEKLLDYLLTNPLSGERSAVAVFVAVLRDRHQPGQALYDELDALYIDVERQHVTVVDIPFVICAMTVKESQDLFTEAIFDYPTATQQTRMRFQQLKQELPAQIVAEYKSAYGDRREDWKPIIDEQVTAQKVIWDCVMDFNRKHQESARAPIYRPRFVSTEFFSEDYEVHSQIWEQLTHSGCVLVIDAISLFHPILGERLRQSHISSSDNVAMLVLSPLNASTMPINRIIEEEFSSHLERAFMRFAKHMDKLCEFGVGDLRAFKRWLFATLPETSVLMQNPRPSPISIDLLSKLVGDAQGIEQLITSEGPVK